MFGLVVFLAGMNSAVAKQTPASPTASPDSQTLLFSDDFERGDLTAWTGNGVIVQSSIMHQGRFAARAAAARKSAYIRHQFDKPLTSVKVQIALNVVSHDNSTLPLLQIRTGGGASIASLVADGQGRLGLATINGSKTVSDAVIADRSWHVLSVFVQIGDQGRIDVSVDGAVVSKLSGALQTKTDPVASVELGSKSASHSFDVVFDDISVLIPKRRATSHASLRTARTVATPSAKVLARPDDPVLHWLPEITAASTSTGVPPSLIAGVMAVESSGDPGIVSVAGAIGLMQVMPDELASHGVSAQDGFDPATNVMIGARILSERAGGGWELAAGYYFGIGCDAYHTCTADYVRAVLAWAEVYAPALNDSFQGDPSVIPAAWEMSPATPTPSPTATPTYTPTPSITHTVTPESSTMTPTSMVSTSSPALTATKAPSPTPTPLPTAIPTVIETTVPTDVPTALPTNPPTDVPTFIPTDVPTEIPTNAPPDSSPPA